MEKMEKQVTVQVNGCEIYNGNKKYAAGAEYSCGEEEAARLVKAGYAILKSGNATAGEKTPPQTPKADVAGAAGKPPKNADMVAATDEVKVK
ncbi:MAG: hypothetical protein Pg6A_15810 [Termitinemataceae bacterium]|nr:MAG: hypothetical protein Pg6A_15810 [Termitinemataceae bacterium]